MKLLIYLFLFFQDSPMIFLEENGVTIKCALSAKIGETYELNNKTYLIVDNQMLYDLVKNNKSTENLVTTFVTDMSYLFYKKKYFKEDISHWDVSNVTNMTFMFGFSEEFDADLSYWNTGKVIYFSDMFHGTKNFNSDVSNWNVSSGTHFNGMFYDSNFNNPINSWNVSKAINMSGMFDDAVNFNQPLFNWDVSNLENMGGMFAEAISFNQNISMWNVSKVKIMDNMFRNASSFSQDLSTWAPNVTGIPSNFQKNNSFIIPRFKVVENDANQNTVVTAVKFLIIPILLLGFLVFYFILKRQALKKSVILFNRDENTFYYKGKKLILNPLNHKVLKQFLDKKTLFLPITQFNEVLSDDLDKENYSTVNKRRERVFKDLSIELSTLLNLSKEEIFVVRNNEFDRRIREIKINIPIKQKATI